MQPRAASKSRTSGSPTTVYQDLETGLERRPVKVDAGKEEEEEGDEDEEEEEERRRCRVLDPSGQLYHHWSLVVSLAFLYNFWALSYRFAFQEINQSTLVLWFTLDYTADLIYLLDILINCRTGYLEEGVLIKNKNKTRHHYQECTRFYLDCLCLLPLDILYLTLGFNSIVRCLRLVKIYKFWNFLDRTERHTNYPNVFRTCTLVHYILVIFHWNACLFHMISIKNILDIQNLYNISNSTCNATFCQYLHAFYWSTLALTTVGDLPRPQTKAEYIYVIVELFFGLFLVATVLGHVSNIVTNVSAARKEFQARLDAVKTFMRMRRVSDKLQDKVIRWFDYLWITQKSSDEERSVACLPDRLKAEIAIHVHLDTLRRVDIFQNTEAGFLCELVLRLKLVLFSPGDYVCRKNEVGHEMYIVSRGYLEVLTENNSSVVATLRAGSYFGEISVLNVGLAGNKRTASVRSVGYSDLFCLNKQDLWDVLKNYPNAELRIRARAEERLNRLDMGGQQVTRGTHKQLPLQLPASEAIGSGWKEAPSSRNQRHRHHKHKHKHKHNHCHHQHHKPLAPQHTSRSLADANELLKMDQFSSSASSSSHSSSTQHSPETQNSFNVLVGAQSAHSGRLWAEPRQPVAAAACLGPKELSSSSLSGAPSSKAHRHRHRALSGHMGKKHCHHRTLKKHQQHLHNGCPLADALTLSSSSHQACIQPPDTSLPPCWHTHLHHHQPPEHLNMGRPAVYCWLAGQQAAPSTGGDATPLLQVPLVAAGGHQLGASSPACSHTASFRSYQRPQSGGRTSRQSAAASSETAAAPPQSRTTSTAAAASGEWKPVEDGASELEESKCGMCKKLRPPEAGRGSADAEARFTWRAATHAQNLACQWLQVGCYSSVRRYFF